VAQFEHRERGHVDLRLSHEEAETLRGLLHDYLPGLKFEVARSKEKEIRHVLSERQTLCERLLEQLSAA
jgi:hypothetical protein